LRELQEKLGVDPMDGVLADPILRWL
jgi:hypothetical protein